MICPYCSDFGKESTMKYVTDGTITWWECDANTYHRVPFKEMAERIAEERGRVDAQEKKSIFIPYAKNLLQMSTEQIPT